MSCMIGCSPNLVVGARELDAATADAAQPADVDLADAAEPAALPDAGGERDAGRVPVDVDAEMNVEMQDDGGAGCASNDQCTDSDEPICNMDDGRCVECLSDTDCDPSELCEDDGECSARPIPCTNALQCAGSEDPICHPTLQVCVECATDANCFGGETCQSDNECD